jgi:hypothetical protein
VLRPAASRRSRAPTRPPSPFDLAALAARALALRQCLDLLWRQVEDDGGEPFTSIGWMKRELISVERCLRAGAETSPITSAVARAPDTAPLAALRAARRAPRHQEAS